MIYELAVSVKYTFAAKRVLLVSILVHAGPVDAFSNASYSVRDGAALLRRQPIFSPTSKLSGQPGRALYCRRRTRVIPDHTPPVSLPTSYLSVDETRQPAISTMDGKDSDSF